MKCELAKIWFGLCLASKCSMKDDIKSSRFGRIFSWLGSATATITRPGNLSRNNQDQTPTQNGQAVPERILGKVLILDDDVVIQRTVTLALEKKGYKVFSVGNISSALRILRQEKLDLILLDLTFPFDSEDVGGPVQDGFFLVEWLKRATGEMTIPIIIISGTDPAKYQDQISAGGIVAFFQKPLAHDELLKAIQGTLGGGRWD